jgi:signal transduction histidine kinase/Flp pilus assembly protein TadD
LFLSPFLCSAQDKTVNEAISKNIRELSEAEKNKNTGQVLELLYQLGKLSIQQGNYQNALDYFNRSLELGRREKNEQIISRASINLANIYLSQGKYNSAVDRYLEALKINERGSDTSLLHVNYLCLGITYYYLKDYGKSLGYYEKCLAINRLKNETPKMAYSYNAMGIIYKEMGDLNTALDYQEKAFTIAETSKDSSLLSHTLGNLGELYGLKGEKEKALTYLKKGLAMQKHFSDDKGIGETLNLLGNVCLKFNDNTNAIAYYQEALQIAEKVGLNDVKKDAYKGLSDAYTALSDFKDALKYQKLYSTVKDTLFNSTNSMQISDMQTRYETEKKEQENTLLLSENNLKTLEIDKQKNQRNLLFILITVLVIIAGLVYNRIQLKNRNKILVEKELRNQAVFHAQEKEKMNLSRELHDGLGPLLSLLKMNISALKNPSDEKIILEMKELANESIREVRSISHALAPSQLQKQGLKAALTDFIAQVEAGGQLKTELHMDFSSPLKPETEIHIYRIVQEAVNNSLRHSEASLLKVSLQQKGDELFVSVEDNGKGFTQKQGGNGLNNILTRSDFLKAKTVINSSPGKGTQLLISLPLEHA